MRDLELGQRLVTEHLSEMSALSRKKWPPIVEREGYRIVVDRPYQGFDGDSPLTHPWWPEPRFWCRHIEIERLSDGARGYGVGPQAQAYKSAIKNIESRP